MKPDETVGAGVLVGFTVSYGILGSTSTITRDFAPGSTAGTVSGLFPGKTYLFRIQVGPDEPRFSLTASILDDRNRFVGLS